MKNIVISIRPRFCKAIYAGTKSLELRKGVGAGFMPGVRLYIYSSSPVKAITGEALIDGVERLAIEKIKSQYLDAACIDEESFDNYYLGRRCGCVVFLRDVYEYRNSLHLKDLAQLGFRAPQSYMYARVEIEDLIEQIKCT